MNGDINEILNQLFLMTGNIGYKLLDDAINNPELDKVVLDENELGK